MLASCVCLAATPPAPPREEGKRSYSQASYTTIRPGSLLATDRARFVPVDLRGEPELRRDAELVKHYGRLAQLDAMLELADKGQGLALQEKVDTVRRSETQRFFVAMQGLRQQLLRALVGATP